MYIVVVFCYVKWVSCQYDNLVCWPNMVINLLPFLIRKKKVPSVPESLLKRRQRFAAIRAVRLKKAIA